MGFNISGTLTACYWSGYADDGIGQDNTGKYSDGNEYFGERENMVNGDWQNAVDAMNAAIEQHDSSCPYRWADNGTNPPSLTTNP